MIRAYPIGNHLNWAAEFFQLTITYIHMQDYFNDPGQT
jgi:hypothetical protein